MITLARALLRLALPRDDRDDVLDDLDEEFARIRGERTRSGAILWFIWQALGSIPFAIALRMRRARSLRGPRAAAPWPASGLPHDLRSAARALGRHRAFTTSAVLTLALGMAVSTSIASIADALLRRPLPYQDPDRLVCLFEVDPLRPDHRRGLSYPDFLDLERTAGTKLSMAGFSGGSRTVTGDGPAERIAIVEVTSGFFATLGVEPLVGRDFRGLTATAVVMLSHRMWERRFARDPLVVGRTMTLNGRPHEIVGVLPASFEFPLRGLADLFVPLVPSPAQADRRYWHWLDVVARVAPDGPLAGGGDAALLAAVLERADPAGHPSAGLRMVPLRDVAIGRVRQPLRLVLIAAALVLLITCTNAAALLLSRWSGRTAEMRVRTAIGATSTRLARQLCVEIGVLAAGGGLVGALAASWLVKAFVAAVPREQAASLPLFHQITLRPSIVLVAIGVACATALVAGALPVVAASGAGLSRLASGTRMAAPGHRRLRTILVVVEVALAVMVLTSTALLGRSIVRLLDVSPGFDLRGVLTARVNLPGARYRDPAAVSAFRNALLERVRTLPGVLDADTIDQLPLTGRGNTATPELHGPRAAGLRRSTVGIRTVGSSYFATMGVPLVAGRAFGPLDVEGAPAVVVVNQAFADWLGPGAALSTTLTFEWLPGRPWTVVGVVGNEQFEMPGAEMRPVVYFPFAQNRSGGFTLVVRTAGRPEALVRPLTSLAASLDADVPLFAIRTMEEIFASTEAVFVRSRVLWLLIIFAVSAMTLAATGLYATLAQSVARQTREFGLRMAVGATRARIAGVVLRRGAGPAVVGVVAGLLGSAFAARAMRALLYDTSPVDPLILAAVGVGVLLIALLASVAPALRATRIDPVTCLKSD